MTIRNDNPPSQAIGAEVDRTPKALVLGAGLSALLAVNALTDLDISVTWAEIGRTDDCLYSPNPEFDKAWFVDDLYRNLSVTRREEAFSWPVIRREGAGFKTTFENGTSSLYGSVFAAPSLALSPPPSSLPPGVESVMPEGISGAPGRCVFLLDYPDRSPGAVGMAAIGQAIRNRNSGGESYVVLRHAPVFHSFGESLYGRAKQEGVLFLRFAGQLPLIEKSSSEGASRPAFTVTVRDTALGGDPVTIECDRVLAATGPDPKSVPVQAVEITGDERDPDGFVLSESIHRHSGQSVINGVFAVGEVTGETDLFGVIRQARSAAVKARAWMMRVEQGDIKESISVGENCIRCLTCHRLCPHQAFYVSAGSARSALGVWGAACRQCGTCISECPRTAVSEPGSWENGVEGFLKDLSLIRDLAPTAVYGCARSAGRAVTERPLPENTAFHGVPCAGR
ncbi:MAG: 4Fe-4S dicluster domain-containing protein, partial [Pseudomonadota bacterium]